MKKLLVVAHTPSPNTSKLIEVLLEGARSSNSAAVTCQSPFDTGSEDLQQADGILLFTTENFGYMSGALKDFFDRTYNDILDSKRGLPYALIVRAGKDGTGARRSTESIVKGLGWRKVQETLVLSGTYQVGFEAKIRELGEAFSVGLAEGII